MAITYPSGYYDRSSATSKRFDQHLFLANHILQSAELNEIQIEANTRIKAVGDVLFRDGAPVSAAQIVVNSSTGASAGDEGIIYASGKLYAVPSSTFTLSTTGTVAVGVYLNKTVVSPEDDADLYDPALEAGSYQEAGASRIKTVPAWGYDGDGQDGDFYSIYTVIDGIIQPYTPPPDISPINQAIARYDRQSTGSNYVSWGLTVSQLDNDGTDQQFLIAEGEARLQGQEIIFRTSQRVFFEEDPDLDTVVAETRTVTSDNPFTVTVNRPPISSVTLITAQKHITAEAVTKAAGNFDDVAERDSLVSVTSIYQSVTTYTNPTHYTLTTTPPTNQVAWVSTVRPSTGTTFYVTYAYTAQYPTDTALLANSSSTHIGIADIDEGSNVSVNYQYKVPRYDRLCIDTTGQAVMVNGVPHADRPVVPSVPNNLLPLAIIHQTWIDSTRSIERDGVRMVPMAELETMNERLDDLTALVADCRAALYGSLYDPSIKRGLFTDSLHNNDMRDTGLDNTAVIDFEDRTLQCDITWTATPAYAASPSTLPAGTPQFALQQTLRSGNTKVNPYASYASFPLVPAQVVLRPNIDTWTEYQTTDLTATALLTRYHAGSQEQYTLQNWVTNPNQRTVTWGDWQTTIVERVRQTTRTEPSPVLRPITVQFTITGFLSEEPLDSVTFDGLTVIPRETP